MTTKQLKREAEPQSQASPVETSAPSKTLSRAIIVTAVATVLLVSGVTALLVSKSRSSSGPAEITGVPASKPSVEAGPVADLNVVMLDPQQASSIKLETVSMQVFQVEKIATGKITFNEDFMTPVFSPYAGRVVRLIAKPGDVVKRGSPLLEIDTPELVQAESELLTAASAVAKARTVLELARRTEDRQHRLYLEKAVALKDWEQAQSDVKNAESELRAAEAAFAAARNRLRLFGKSDEEIAAIERERKIDRVARILSPITGTITARKVGPGQYVRPDSAEPLFIIADLSTMWMLAEVYESDVPLIEVGQPVEVHVLAYPNEPFKARISYVGASVDPSTHRVAVRCVVENRGQKLKPDMFATFRIITNEVRSLAVPLSAIVRDGDKTSVWVAQKEGLFARREVSIGLEQNGFVQILSGLQLGERVVSEGGLFLSNVVRTR